MFFGIKHTHKYMYSMMFFILYYILIIIIIMLVVLRGNEKIWLPLILCVLYLIGCKDLTNHVYECEDYTIN